MVLYARGGCTKIGKLIPAAIVVMLLSPFRQDYDLVTSYLGRINKLLCSCRLADLGLVLESFSVPSYRCERYAESVQPPLCLFAYKNVSRNRAERSVTSFPKLQRFLFIVMMQQERTSVASCGVFWF